MANQSTVVITGFDSGRVAAFEISNYSGLFPTYIYDYKIGHNDYYYLPKNSQCIDVRIINVFPYNDELAYQVRATHVINGGNYGTKDFWIPVGYNNRNGLSISISTTEIADEPETPTSTNEAFGGGEVKSISFNGDYMLAFTSLEYDPNVPALAQSNVIKVYKNQLAAINNGEGSTYYKFVNSKVFRATIYQDMMWFNIYVMDVRMEPTTSKQYNEEYDVGSISVWVPYGSINESVGTEIIFSNEILTVDGSMPPSEQDILDGKDSSNITPKPDYDDDDDGTGQPEGQPEAEPEARDDYAIDFSSSKYSEEASWYDELYWMNNNGNLYSLKSFESIVGMPIQFMANVDARFGQSTFGKQYSEDILYDAPICIIDPGAPNLADSSLAEGASEGFDNLIKKIATYYTWGQSIAAGNGKEVLELWLKEWLVGEDGGSSFARFYGFESQYLRYIQYVNTLCHLFATYLGIADEIIPGTDKKFKEYDDYIDEVETTDSGLGLKLKYGNYPGLLIYYQPDSSLSQTFNNQTQESSLASKLNELSNYSKEMAFLAGGLGFPGKGVTVGDGISTSTMFSLSDLSFSFGSNNILKRIFNRAGEGVGTIIGGNNLTLPEIYSNSNMTGSEYVLNIKLVNPYGSPEAAFLFQMRHLARLLAVSLPRQYGPNGYTAPFIIRAFSKGQFNIQLGIVESLSIRRAGNGGENQTIHGIPMELEITMVLKDMYQQIAISNEYTNAYGLPSLSQLSNIKQLKLIFNNIGLIDFIASYAGYNLNQPSIDVQMDFILNSMWNNLSDVVKFNGTINVFKWEFPRYSRSLRDNFMNAIWVRNTWIA